MQYLCLPYGLDTPREYRIPAVRAFHRGVLRAFHGMRISQRSAPVWLPSRWFPLQSFPEYRPVLKWANDSSDRFVVCEDRRLYLRPVNSRLMGVMGQSDEGRVVHGGQWLSLALVLSFTSG